MDRKHFIIHTLSFFFLSISLSRLASAADLKEIEQRGKLIVAVKDNLRPLGFRDAAGNPQGLEIDIARRLAEEILGRPNAAVLQPVANRDRLNVVLAGKVDLAIANVTATASRSRLVDFSAAYYLDGTALVTKDAAVKQHSDLVGKKVAVIKGSSTIAQLKFSLPNSRLVGVDSYTSALALLESGNAAAFAADASVLAGWVQEYPQYRLLPSRLSTAALCVVMPRGLQYEPLRSRVNQALARWKAEGWIEQRAAYWGLP